MTTFKEKEPWKTELNRILAWKSLPILSLYMPVKTGGPDKRENEVRFKSLLQEAESMLKEADWKPSDIESWKRPLVDTYGPEFWAATGQPGFVSFYLGAGHQPAHWFLADPVEPLAVLQRRAHVKPLMEAWSWNPPYYLLCLDHEHLTLYSGDAFTLEELNDPSIANSLKEALGEEREIKSIQFRTETPGSVSDKRAAVFHGQGGPGNVRDDQMKRFFQQVEPAVTARIARDPRPLVLCGSPEVLRAYLDQTSSPDVMEDRIERHPESLSNDEARGLVSALMKKRASGIPVEALARYKELGSKLRVVDSVDTVLPLAAAGRVQNLFVSRDHETWGRFDPESQRVERFEAKGYNREDLLDTCARLVLEYGGEIDLLPERELARHTGARHVAAILRPSG